MDADNRPGCGFLRSKAGIALLAFGAIAALYVITEHQAHLWGWLPFLLLLACPLMHLFMHGGHGGHGRRRGGRRDGAAQHDSGAGKARQGEAGDR